MSSLDHPPGSTLNVPASPSVPHSVESKILDVCPSTCGEPLLSIPRRDPLAVLDEYKPVMLADLPADQCDGLAAQRNADRLIRFRVIWMNPCATSNQIELRPFEAENVGLFKPGRKPEPMMRARTIAPALRLRVRGGRQEILIDESVECRDEERHALREFRQRRNVGA
ncbi:hypothetical protein [Burkholderia sp. NLJ2]|uniref:hypothetical protein n=1 Tax=Burkholderia sp. NLJ2 TaxID=3090699 RepID=UPI003C6BEC17